MRIGTSRAMAVVGVQGRVVKIEAVLLSGLPAVTIVGLPDAAVSESRERVRAAFASAGIAFPDMRLTINLSPADTPKSGTAFDLGIAVAILAAMGGQDAMAGSVVMGELGLDGSARRIRGILPAALATARLIESGGTGDGATTRIVVPFGCAQEARLADVPVTEVWHLTQVADMMGVPCAPIPGEPELTEDGGQAEPADGPDMADVRGQLEARHAIEVAAAGGHHILMTGAPGVGKSMLACRMPTIMPQLETKQAVEVATIASTAGEFSGRLSRVPPFCAPHHTSSAVAMVGGGPLPKPGAASRAHCGVLFLDEMPEFSAASLQALREPMETGVVEIHRSKAVVSYPARFQLVGAANPCRCGNYLDAPSSCTCSVRERRDYFRKIGGPVLDRFDLNVVTRRYSRAELAAAGQGETSAAVAQRVALARERQAARLAETPWSTNAQVSGTWLRRNTRLGEHADDIEDSLARGEISMRAVDKLLRVAWTLADLAGRDDPARDDVDAAMALRLRGGFHGAF